VVGVSPIAVNDRSRNNDTATVYRRPEAGSDRWAADLMFACLQYDRLRTDVPLYLYF